MVWKKRCLSKWINWAGSGMAVPWHCVSQWVCWNACDQANLATALSRNSTSISGNEEVRGGKCGSRSDCQDSRVIEYTLMLSDYSGFSSLSPFRNSFSLIVLLFAWSICVINVKWWILELNLSEKGKKVKVAWNVQNINNTSKKRNALVSRCVWLLNWNKRLPIPWWRRWCRPWWCIDAVYDE